MSIPTELEISDIAFNEDSEEDIWDCSLFQHVLEHTALQDEGEDFSDDLCLTCVEKDSDQSTFVSPGTVPTTTVDDYRKSVLSIVTQESHKANGNVTCSYIHDAMTLDEKSTFNYGRIVGIFTSCLF
jgi:hypothetical protein